MALRRLVAPEKLEHLRLLVSELVTNSIQYAGLSEEERIGLLVSVRDRLIRVEVHDGGPGFEKITYEEPPLPEQIGGWGLYLVEKLSERWGVESNDLVCVWFEIVYDGE